MSQALQYGDVIQLELVLDGDDGGDFDQRISFVCSYGIEYRHDTNA